MLAGRSVLVIPRDSQRPRSFGFRCRHGKRLGPRRFRYCRLGLAGSFAQGFADAAEKDANSLKRLPQMEVCAVVNDSEAVLLSAAYRDPYTKIALILGTGVNAAALLPSPFPGPAEFIIVNTELSLLGGSADTSQDLDQNYLPTTSWDKQVDAASQRPGFQPLETRVGESTWASLSVGV